jgi:ArsR family transcriptional regulator
MIDASAPSATSVAELAKALADPTRVEIVDVLRAAPGAVCQCELNTLFDVSQPTLSHHLKKLRDAGFVDVERRGKWAYYSIDPRALEALDAWLS